MKQKTEKKKEKKKRIKMVARKIEEERYGTINEETKKKYSTFKTSGYRGKRKTSAL